MRAVTIPRFGPPSVLEVRESADPSPGPGEVRIRVHAAGLNFAEVTARQGLYPDAPPPPMVVGYEVAGEIDALGPGVNALQSGQRVMALTRFGGHASLIVVPERQAIPIPDAMPFDHAAAIPVNYVTAHHMLFQIGPLHPGSSVLVHMAAGGVGTAVLQLLQTVPDIRSFGTSSAPKHGYLRELGCTDPIDYRSKDYAEEVLRLTGGKGVDVVLDPLGGDDWRKGWNLLRPGGRLVAFGWSRMIDGDKRKLLRVARQLLKMPFFTPMGAMDANKSLQGVNMGHMWDEVEVLRSQIERIIDLYGEGVVQPQIFEQVPFSKAAHAHELLEQGLNRGKVLLLPDGP